MHAVYCTWDSLQKKISVFEFISGGTVVQLENWRALRQTYFLASVLLNRNIDANLTSVLWISSCDHKQVISALHDWKRGETETSRPKHLSSLQPSDKKTFVKLHLFLFTQFLYRLNKRDMQHADWCA